MKVLPQNERAAILLVVTGVLLATLLGWYLFWTPMQNSLRAKQARIVTQAATVRWMAHTATKIESLQSGNSQVIAPTRLSLLMIVNETIAKNGLATVLDRIQPEGTMRVGVRFERAPFGRIMAWLTDLQQAGVEVTQALVEHRQEPGQVKVKLVLIRK